MSSAPALGHLLHAAVLGLGGVGLVALQAPRAAQALGLLRAPTGGHDRRVAELRHRAATGTLAVLERPPAGDHPAYAARAATWTPLAATSSVAAAGVHLAVAPLHLADPALAGLFALAALAQLGWALAVLGLVPVPRRAGLRVAGAVVHGACLAAWVTSRTTGLPLGLHDGAVSPVGPLDLVAAAWAATALAWCLRPGAGTDLAARRAPWSGTAWAWLAGCAVVLTTLGTWGGHA
ncbi:hypothetical protein [Nocardioides perillae]|uniref:Uncharacterized protein n=1 Tax=Nocardioides perillae TaxID=1119534 RepID=A0A7Y9RTC7_9ACTN|nr:hypothetical protein [Nocardioides perillae]NYG54513.1 hypothetical protein [Nocardioides perillae]